MKRSKILFAILCMIAVLLSGCARAQNEGFSIFKSSPMRLRIEYPSTWTMQVDNEKKTAAFVSPQEGYSDQYRDNVTVTVTDLSTAKDFAEYIELYGNSLPSTLKGFTLHSKEEIFLGGVEAVRFCYSSRTIEKDENNKDQTTEMKFLQCVAYANEQVYTITYMAQPSSYDYFESYVKIMLETVRFKA